MLMAIDKNTGASALADREHGPSPGTAGSSINSDQGRADNEADRSDEGRSLAFVYVMVAFVVGLAAIGWAVSAIF